MFTPRQMAAKLHLLAARLEFEVVTHQSLGASWRAIPEPLRVDLVNFGRDIQHDMGEVIRRQGLDKSK